MFQGYAFVLVRYDGGWSRRPPPTQKKGSNSAFSTSTITGATEASLVSVNERRVSPLGRWED